jgi:hypothetical protein
MLEGYVRRIERQEDLAYNYIGGWDELMEEAKSEIAETVKELRLRT